MNWNNNLYCTHPYHVVRVGHPEHISRKLFSEKQCGVKPCAWMKISKSIPIERKESFKLNKKQSSKENKLISFIQEREKEIIVLRDEVIGLYKKIDDEKERYRKLMIRLMNLNVSEG